MLSQGDCLGAPVSPGLQGERRKALGSIPWLGAPRHLLAHLLLRHLLWKGHAGVKGTLSEPPCHLDVPACRQSYGPARKEKPGSQRPQWQVWGVCRGLWPECGEVTLSHTSQIRTVWAADRHRQQAHWSRMAETEWRRGYGCRLWGLWWLFLLVNLTTSKLTKVQAAVQHL